MAYVHVWTMSEASERIKGKVLFMQLGIAIRYQYGSAYFPAPYADNQLLCNVCELQIQLGLAVGLPTLAISPPKNTPETISEGQKSKILLEGMPPDPPPAGMLCTL